MSLTRIARPLLLLSVGVLAASCGSNPAVSGGACAIACGPGLVCGPNGGCIPEWAVADAGNGGQHADAGQPGTGMSGDGLPCDVQNLVGTYCSSCHGPTLQNGAPFTITRRADLTASSPSYAGQTIGDRSLARMRNTAAPMPPFGYPQPSQSEIDTFASWLQDGMPAGTCGSNDAGTGNEPPDAGGQPNDAGTGNEPPDAGGQPNDAGSSTPDAGTGEDTGNYCAACSSDSDCGGAGNYCIGFSFGDYCGIDCSNGQTCPSNTRCAQLVDNNNNVVGENCVPLAGETCSSGSGGGTGNYCAACTSDADCGGGNNYCLGFNFGDYCGTDCGSGQSCPTDSHCAQIVDSSNNPIGMNCVPNSGLTCSSTGGGTDGGTSGGTDGGTCTPDTWSGWPAQFFNTHCNSCHTHTGEFTTGTYVRSRRSTIASYISSGYMPEGSTLTSADKTRILNWLNCGAP